MKWNKIKATVNIGRKYINKGTKVVKDHGPAIATGISIGCWIGSLVMMGIEAPKAHQIWKEKAEKDPEATKLELAASVAPVLWKPVALAAGGTAFEIFSLKMSNARIMAATSLAAAAMSDRNALYTTAKELVGEEKAEEIRQKATEKKIEKEGKKVVKGDGFEVPGDEEIRKIIFGPTGVPFYSSPARIRKNMEDAITTLASADELCLNDLEYYIGAPHGELSQYLMYTFGGFAGPYSVKAYERACEQLRYDLIPVEDDYGRLCWKMEMAYSPDYYCKQ